MDNSKLFAFNGAPFIIVCCIMFAALCYYAYNYISVQGKKSNDKCVERVTSTRVILIVFGAAFILRLILGALYFGHQDVTFFRYWLNELTNNPPFNYYDKLSVPDGGAENSYLPGYLYILYFLGKTINFLNIPPYPVLLKLPSIICDLLTALVILYALKKYTGKNVAFAASLLYLFNPAVILNSSLWGQVDSFTALFTVLSIYLILRKKFMLSYICAAVGIAFKLQFVFVLPILGIYTLKQIYIYIVQKNFKKLKSIVLAFVAAIITFIIIVLPFALKYMLEGDIFFIFKVYFGQTDLFNFFALNTFNFFSMIYKNWVQIPSSPVLGIISWGMLNYVLIAVISLYSMMLVLKSNKKSVVYTVSAFLIIAVFTFSIKMHERYMYTALAPLLIAAVLSKDKKIFGAFAVFSVLHFLNTGVLLFKEADVRYFVTDDLFLIFFSIISVLYFLYFAYIATVSALAKDKTNDNIINQDSNLQTDNIASQSIEESSNALEETENDYENEIQQKTEFYNQRYNNNLEIRKQTAIKKKDVYNCLVMFVIYMFINLIYLGGTAVPQTYWEVKNSNDYIILEIPEQSAVSEIWAYKGIDITDSTNNAIRVYATDTLNSESPQNIITASNFKGRKSITNNGREGSGSMYKWFKVLTLKDSHKYIAFTASKNTRINEIVLIDKDGKIIDYTIVQASTEDENGIRAAFDERHLFPGYNSLITDMYFDEIYHARTAFEHIKGWQPYEITHPPLGKIIISIGIRIFGMNPFGWRISGALFSALLVPVLYLLGKLLFKKRLWAVIFALLGAVNGLQFVQGRIATIDTYPVFFSVLSMIFMLIFFRTNILREKTIKCLIPFAVSGIFFGFAAASKWTGIYTGAGLLALLIVYVYRMLDEYRFNAAKLEREEKEIKHYSKEFDKKLIYIIITGMVFFVFIPFAIYLLSYIPYMINGEKSLSALFNIMIENQKYMYSYHGEWVVGTTHQCQSPWYSWLVNYRSVFMYMGNESVLGYARIHSMGNHIIIWGGLAALIFCIYTVFKKQIYAAINVINKADKEDYIKKQLKKGNTVNIKENSFKIRTYTPMTGENKDILIFIFAGFLAAFLPWIFVDRSTFIYHFYPSMPYYAAFITFSLITLCNVYNKPVKTLNICNKQISVTKGGIITAIYITSAVLIFILLFPVFTGIPISRAVANILYSWVRFFGGHVGL